MDGGLFTFLMECSTETGAAPWSSPAHLRIAPCPPPKEDSKGHLLAGRTFGVPNIFIKILLLARRADEGVVAIDGFRIATSRRLITTLLKRCQICLLSRHRLRLL